MNRREFLKAGAVVAMSPSLLKTGGEQNRIETRLMVACNSASPASGPVTFHNAREPKAFDCGPAFVHCETSRCVATWNVPKSDIPATTADAWEYYFVSRLHRFPTVCVRWLEIPALSSGFRYDKIRVAREFCTNGDVWPRELDSRTCDHCGRSASFWRQITFHQCGADDTTTLCPSCSAAFYRAMRGATKYEVLTADPLEVLGRMG
jgi:hypothetical protein